MKYVTSRFIHYSLLVTLLLLAFFFRTYQLAGLGLGLEHDEVAEWQIANNIRHGENALFFKEAYGQEPMFLYLMAGSTALIGDNVIGIRFTSVFVAMLTLAVVYRMLRRMFSPFVALIALAGLSIALWPVFWGRVGLRAMTLPLMLCLGFDFLWRGLIAEVRSQKSEVRSPAVSLSRRLSFSLSRKPFIIAGIFLGLSAYTYLSSRAIPILLIAFTFYLALFARDRMRGRWRNLFICFAVAIVVALPLAITVLMNPDLQFRVSEVSGPLDQALKGDTKALMANIPLAFGMFTSKGDSTVRDNWPDRPVFPKPIGQALFIFGFVQALFIFGFVIALSKFKQPRYALVPIWLGAMLIPSIVTSGAPNFTRTLGALPMAFALPAIGLEWLSMWPLRMIAMPQQQKLSRLLAPIAIVFLIGVFAINAASTFDDYFNKWPNHPETQFVFQADFAAIAKDINASDVMNMSVGGLSNDTMDDDSLRLLLQRKDVHIRWFDSGSPLSSGGSLLNPTNFTHYASGPYVYIPAIVPFAPDLKNYTDIGLFRPVVSDKFTRYDPIIIPLSNIMRVEYFERDFEDTVSLLTWQLNLPSEITAGSDLSFVSEWFVRNPIAYPRRIFVHLIDPRTGQIISQHDGLDSPTRFWHVGDLLLQLHILSIPSDTPLGKYELWIGLYDPVTGQRVMQTDFNHTQSPSDQYLLGTIQVTH
jgi:4-amino-4-deoxy-L-arabinose transferase-like glycosyltransferase